MDKQLVSLENAIYCLVEAMGMNAENMQRQRLGESMAFTEEDFVKCERKWRD
jgi:hypothetical protein